MAMRIGSVARCWRTRKGKIVITPTVVVKVVTTVQFTVVSRGPKAAVTAVSYVITGA